MTERDRFVMKWRRSKKWVQVAAGLMVGGLVMTAHAADPPGVLNHQGRISVNGVNHDGTGYFKFALVTSGGTTTTTLWSSDGTSTGGGTPTAAVPVPVVKGHYAVPLGETTFHANMTNAIPASVFTDNADVRLRVWFSATMGGTFEQLSPDRRVASAGYAMNAAQAMSVAAGAVGLSGLAFDVTFGSLPGMEGLYFGDDGVVYSSGFEVIAPEGGVGVTLDSTGLATTGTLRAFVVSGLGDESPVTVNFSGGGPPLIVFDPFQAKAMVVQKVLDTDGQLLAWFNTLLSSGAGAREDLRVTVGTDKDWILEDAFPAKYEVVPVFTPGGASPTTLYERVTFMADRVVLPSP